MAKALKLVENLGKGLDEDEKNIGHKDTVLKKEAPDPQGKESDKTMKRTPGKGIRPGSPTVYLLPEEKKFLSLLAAEILLENGEKVTHHEILMRALYEYSNNHYQHFYKKHHDNN